MDATPLSLRVETPRPELGALLAAVCMMIDDQRSVVLHVAAARHGEGATTVARELAAAAARMGWCRVALVEVAASTMALPCLMPAFERGAAPVLRRAWLGGAEVMVARLAGPGDRMPRVETLRGMFAWLRSEFTLTVVDGAPVLDAGDGAMAAAVADGTLLVVAAERSARSDTVQARAVLDRLGATVLGAVLNRRRTRLPRLLERLL